MALVPNRNIGQYGVNTDIDPLDQTTNQFTMAVNARFTENKITHAPVWSWMGQTTTSTHPRWLFTYQLNGSITYLSFFSEGNAASLAPAAIGSPLGYTDVTVSGYTTSSQSLPFTTNFLSNVVYVNRSDRVPWALLPGNTAFINLANWDSTWRCSSLRAFNGCLVALNVTKGAINYPTMVKTSDFAVFGTVPGTWTASLTNSATENVLSDMKTPIIDGWPLRDRFIIYGQNEVWQMTTSGDSLIYDYSKLFSNYGIISQNCVAEINNVHYVFGDNDIWMNDGYTPKSLAVGRVRDFIYNSLSKPNAYQFFVWTNFKLNEVMFCYVSTDPYCAFPVDGNGNAPGCNRAAVYNYAYDTWTFYDLPYIVGGGLGPMYTNSGTGVTWAGMGSSEWSTVSGVWNASTDPVSIYNIALGAGNFTIPTNGYVQMQSSGSMADASHLYAFEKIDSNVGLGQVLNVVNAPVYLENIQMDMDEIAPELRGYKVVTTMYPEGRVSDITNPMNFWYGSSDYSGQQATYGNVMTFDGQSNYKLDFNSPGRFISLRMILPSPPQKFTWNGMDIEYKVFAHR